MVQQCPFQVEDDLELAAWVKAVEAAVLAAVLCLTTDTQQATGRVGKAPEQARRYNAVGRFLYMLLWLSAHGRGDQPIGSGL